MSTQATTPKIDAPKIDALEVSRVFAAPRERVFRAWSSAAELSRWFGPTPEHRTVVPEFEFRVGGRYRMEFHCKGKVNIVSGVYRENQEPEKLVFTWIWDQPGAAETLVTLTFRDLGASTEVTVTHVGFTSVEERESHRQGWTGGLENLSKAI